MGGLSKYVRIGHGVPGAGSALNLCARRVTRLWSRNITLRLTAVLKYTLAFVLGFVHTVVI